MDDVLVVQDVGIKLKKSGDSVRPRLRRRPRVLVRVEKHVKSALDGLRRAVSPIGMCFAHSKYSTIQPLDDSSTEVDTGWGGTNHY